MALNAAARASSADFPLWTFSPMSRPMCARSSRLTSSSRDRPRIERIASVHRGMSDVALERRCGHHAANGIDDALPVGLFSGQLFLPRGREPVVLQLAC